MNTPHTAVIAGATGLVGHHLLNDLLAGDYYTKVIALTRRPFDTHHPKLEQRIINFDNLPEIDTTGFEHADFYCCLGTTIKKAGSRTAFRQVDFHYPLELARLCKNNKGNQFLIISAMGADSDSMFFYNRVKGDVEKAISNLQIQTLHIFRPSLLMGDRNESRVGEDISKKFFNLFGFLFVGPLKKYKGIKGTDVAWAMYAKARKDVSGKFIYESDEIAHIAHHLYNE
jgi:uncharacterized protein YbjT (DUF2867 family)